MSSQGSATTKNKKNQKVGDWGFELITTILVTELAGILAEIILSFLHVGSGRADFVECVVMLVTFFSALMYFIRQDQEARQEQVVEK
jgi:hypothetical protein